MQITKTDYLDYSFCKKNLWLKKHKPELFYGVELSDFEKKIIEEGNIADEEARKLYPNSVLVYRHGKEAVEDTKQYIEKQEEVIFQATFSHNDFFIRADILVFDKEHDGYELYEVKATNDIKRKEANNHVNDLAFQKTVIESTGLKIIRAGIIHLNHEYKKIGKVNHHELFITEEITDEVVEAQEKVKQQMSDIKQWLSMDEQNGCECLYRGRSNQCTTFRYSNPDVPEYSVHDINSIGRSKKVLTDWIDRGIYDLKDIDNVEDLSDKKKNQIQSYLLDRQIIDKEGIKNKLSELSFPLYFFDYEGFITAIPIFDGFGSYEQVPFQYSLHIMQEDGSIEHKEFLITKPKGDLTRPLIERIKEDIDPKGTLITWHSQYERDRNRKLAELHPEFAGFINTINEKMFDLKTIFSEDYYIDPKFKGGASIKDVLPVVIPELSYTGMNISKGDQAAERWERMISKNTPEDERDKIAQDLLDYCKLDTWAMVKIYQFLMNL